MEGEVEEFDAAFEDAAADIVAAAEGGVSFSGPRELALFANLESRLASRILWQVAHGRYRNEDDLYRLVQAPPPLLDVSPEWAMDFLPTPFDFELDPGMARVFVTRV